MNHKIKLLLSAIFSLMIATASAQYVEKAFDLNQLGAIQLAEQARSEAHKIDKNISIAILNNAGVTLLLLKGDNVGPHNTEASRRKAYTALSTKTPSLELMQKAAVDITAQNLNTMPELLLLGGGAPLWKDGALVGSIGVSGGGGGQNDHDIAKQAAQNLGFTITKQ